MTKTILITGASSGIGAACAHHAVDAGHRVTLAARSKDKLADLVSELGEDNALAISCDVTDFGDQQAMFDKTIEKFGSIDVVYANAGLGATAKGTENGDPDNFKQMIDVNIYGVTLTAKLAIPHLKKSKGHFLVTGSRAGHVTIDGSVYGASKWFIKGYAKNLAAELSGTGVRVTSIDPGMVDTPFFDDEKPDALRPDDIARAFIYAISQPDTVWVADMEVYPTPKAE